MARSRIAPEQADRCLPERCCQIKIFKAHKEGIPTRHHRTVYFEDFTPNDCNKTGSQGTDNGAKYGGKGF
jgi:hypothetical protein